MFDLGVLYHTMVQAGENPYLQFLNADLSWARTHTHKGSQLTLDSVPAVWLGWVAWIRYIKCIFNEQ